MLAQCRHHGDRCWASEPWGPPHRYIVSVPCDDMALEVLAPAGHVLRGLDEAQRACVVHPPGPLAVVAGPGSGKTRVLTDRVAYRVLTGTAEARRTMVLTFTRRAAGELTSRLRRLDVEGAWCSTLHSMARTLLERFWADHDVPRRVLTQNPIRLMEEALSDGAITLCAGVVRRELEWARPRAITAAAYVDAVHRSRRHVGAPAEAVAAALAHYERYKQRRRVMELDDLLPELLGAFEHPAFAEPIRWRFRHFCVDEAQDLSRAQWRVLRALLGDGDDLCMVGDADQTIYQWNGADPRYLEGFLRIFPNAALLELHTNYRSARSIVVAAHSLLDKTAPTPVGAGTPGSVRLDVYDDEDAEARAVVWRIRQLRAKGTGLSRIAVLARTHRTLEVVERQLRVIGVPVRTGRNLLDEPEIRRALREVRTLRADQSASATLADLQEIVAAILAELRGAALADAGEDLSLPPAPVHGYAAERLGQLVELVREWATELPSSQARYLPDWLSSTTRARGGDPGQPQVGVELATFHRAKGLQWEDVFVVGLEDGLVPLEHTDNSEEERRLLYVALTRAERTLSCSWARSRKVAGVRLANQPSPWLAAIDGPHADIDGDGATSQAQTAGALVIAQIRATLLRPPVTPSGSVPGAAPPGGALRDI